MTIIKPNHDEQLRYRAGGGNWAAYVETKMGLNPIIDSAKMWSEKLAGVSRPWLCWNVDDDWCLAQQKLVHSAGWTPVVGFDPRVGRPAQVISDAILIDFNEKFDFPVMWPMFPLEFAFLFAERLAFWHSDLMIRHEKMNTLAATFSDLRDGSMMAVKEKFSFGKLLVPKKQRYWELVGCCTKGASEDQFHKGCGWWMNFYAHPNCPSEEERVARSQYYWDHGTGIKYWSDKYDNSIQLIEERFVSEGHCTQIKNKKYERVSPNNERRDLSKDLRHNFELEKVCSRLGLQDLLEIA